MNQLGRKEESLKARYELLDGRLSTPKRGSSFSQKEARKGNSGNGAVLGDDKVKELKRLQQKKERLQYAIERLELQSKQRERELRKSMAFVRE